MKKPSEKIQARVHEFLASVPTGVLATMSKDKPRVSSVYFHCDVDFNTYFLTKINTTKHKNISANPNVAMVIYNSHKRQTVQLDGVASIIADTNQRIEVFEHLLEIGSRHSDFELPPFSKVTGGHYDVFQITPTWLRWADYSRPGPMTRFHEIITPQLKARRRTKQLVAA